MDEPTDPVIPSETDLCRLAELVEMFDPGEDVEFPDKVSVVSEHKICTDRFSKTDLNSVYRSFRSLKTVQKEPLRVEDLTTR